MTDHLGAHIIDDLSNPNDRNWVYFTDTVMGGVSKGNLEFKEDKDESYYRLTGFVNTDNNGGFIQFATGVSGVPDKKYQGIRIKVRGNNENYELHIRTRLTPTRYRKIISTQSSKIFVTSRLSNSTDTTQDQISTITTIAMNDSMSTTTPRITTNTTPLSTMNTTSSSNIKYLQESGKFRVLINFSCPNDHDNIFDLLYRFPYIL